MKRTNVSEQKKQPPETDAVADDLARALGMTGPMPQPESGAPPPSIEDGPLELDKDGTLARLEKLPPVKAHRAADDPAPPKEKRSAGPKKAKLPPKLSLVKPKPTPPAVETPPDRFDVGLEVPGGVFAFGEDRAGAEVPAFRIDKYPVTNAQYEVFVRATGHRPPLYWRDGHLPEELSDHPVVGVDYYDALAYARFKGADLPFEDEWERAARGTDGRTFPWGDETDLSAANTARSGLKTTLPVDAHPENVSPVGCVDIVGNAWEITHSPAPGGGIVVRGGSWYDFALYAKTWFRFAARADTRNGTIGFRLVRRDGDREAAREVDPTTIDAEILARTGAQAPVDTEQFSPEKRDLVPDLRRLRAMQEDLDAEARKRDGRPPAPERSAAPPVDAIERKSYAPTKEPKKLGSKRAKPVSAGNPEPEPTPEVERAHVEDRRADPAPSTQRVSSARSGALGSTTPAVEETGGDAAEVAQGDDATAPPVPVWTLVVVGFLLVGSLVFMLVDRAAKPAPTPGPQGELPGEPVPEISLEATGLPDRGEPADLAPLGVLDADDERLQHGTWLLVFVDPGATGAVASLRAVKDIALRLIDTGVRPAVVFPRGQIVAPDESWPDAATLDDRVQDASDFVLGLTVVLDAGTLSSAFEVGDGIAAAATVDGVLEIFTRPPGEAFSPRSLGHIAAPAMRLTPGTDRD